ncbi:hypothetical protein DLM75_09000 [Leptospira stimsonii]|uniref:Lipoprotein n=1 Tax=Leptospira stimsonii TaxID=2202203 RepID=A0A396Z4V9_9LEPT|nr:hypothetical protein DLM75_09000 [Leptospira stimsonii]
MKNLRCRVPLFAHFILFLSFPLCSRIESEINPVNDPFQNLFYWFLLTAPKQTTPYYDSDCDTLPMNILVNSVQTGDGTIRKFKFQTDSNGLKYKLTLSSDYPNCGAELLVYNCKRPNLYATNSSVFCNVGSYSAYFAGGTQTCAIPNFGNQEILLSITTKTPSFPLQPCQSIQLEILP